MQKFFFDRPAKYSATPASPLRSRIKHFGRFPLMCWTLPQRDTVTGSLNRGLTVDVRLASGSHFAPDSVDRTTMCGPPSSWTTSPASSRTMPGTVANSISSTL